MCKKEYIHAPSRNNYFCSIKCYGKWHVGSNSATYGNRFLDVAIPSIRTDYEYDGEYWHQDKEKDKKRDFEINSEGWDVIHINQKDLEVMISKKLILPLNSKIVCK